MRPFSVCPNCKERPRYVKSDDPEWPVKLEHLDTMCPAPYRVVIYHNTQKEASDAWEKHVKESVQG